MTKAIKHWHTANGLTGYGPDDPGTWSTSRTLDDLAECVQNICTNAAEYEYETANTAGEAGDYKTAWLTAQNGDRFANMASKFDAARASAPLFLYDPKKWHETILEMIEEFPITYYGDRSKVFVWECDSADCLEDDSADCLEDVE